MKPLFLSIFLTAPALVSAEETKLAKYTPNMRAVMKQVIMADYQTGGIPYPDPGEQIRSIPTDEEVAKVVTKTRFESIDLNHDGILEILVWINIGRGKKGNGPFHVLSKHKGIWKLIGTLDGNRCEITPRKNDYSEITGISWGGRDSGYTATIYRYSHGRYHLVESRPARVESN